MIQKSSPQTEHLRGDIEIKAASQAQDFRFVSTYERKAARFGGSVRRFGGSVARFGDSVVRLGGSSGGSVRWFGGLDRWFGSAVRFGDLVVGVSVGRDFVLSVYCCMKIPTYM